MNENEKSPEPNFTTEDAALLIGRGVIEIHVLRKGLDDLMKRQAELTQKVEDMIERRPGPTRVVASRAEEPDASAPGET